MRKKRFKKILSVILVLVMVVGILPMSAFAYYGQGYDVLYEGVFEDGDDYRYGCTYLDEEMRSKDPTKRDDEHESEESLQQEDETEPSAASGAEYEQINDVVAMPLDSSYTYAQEALALIDAHIFTPVVQIWITNAATTRTAAIDVVRGQVNTLLASLDVTAIIPAPGTGVSDFPNPPANFGVPPTNRTFTVNITGDDGSTASATIVVSIEFLPLDVGPEIETARVVLSAHGFTPIVQPWISTAANTRTPAINSVIAQINAALTDAGVAGVTAAVPAPINELPTLTGGGLPALDRILTVNLTGPGGTFGSTRITVNMEFLQASATGITLTTRPMTGMTLVVSNSDLQLNAAVLPAGVPQAVNWSVSGHAEAVIDVDTGFLSVGNVPVGTIVEITAVTTAAVGADGNPVSNTMSVTVANYITVYVSVEAFTIGRGFVVEPTPVRIPAGAAANSNAMRAFHTLLEGTPYSALTAAGAPATTAMGRLGGIANIPADPPQFILDATAASGSGSFNPNGTNPLGLGNGDFGMLFAGWMFSHNHVLPAVGAASVALNDGDVVRWMFTLLGNDLGTPEAGGGMGFAPSVFAQANTTELTRELFNPVNEPISPQARQFAMSAIENPLASEQLATAALAWIVDGIEPNITTEPATVVLNRAAWNNAVRGQLQTFSAGVFDHFGNSYSNQDVIWSLSPIAHPSAPTAGASAGATSSIHPNTVYSNGTVILYSGQAGGSMTLTATSAANANIFSTASIATARTALEQAQIARIVLINAVTEGLNQNDYTAESWEALQTAITNAIAAVNAAQDVASVNAVEIPDINILVSGIYAAREARIAAINAVVTGRNPDHFTPESWAALQTAITNAIAEVNAAQDVAAINAVAIPDANAILVLAQTDRALHQPALDDVLLHLRNTITEPTFGDEWVLLAQARGGFVNTDYYDGYLGRLLTEIADKPDRLGPPTDNARLILAVTALGLDASDLEGRDLTAPLADIEWVTQSVNAAIFALLALDSGNYGIQATRDALIAHIVAAQQGDGSWGWGFGDSDPDLTAMALQALAPYRARAEVNSAVNEALDWLSDTQSANGGWAVWGSYSAETSSQVVIALTALEIDPQTDLRFIQPGGYNPITSLLSFRDDATGGFISSWTNEVNRITTEQAAQALVAYDRFLRNANRLFDMSDAMLLVSEAVEPAPVSRAALAEAIAEAGGLIQSNYTAETWAAMQTALQNAISVYENEDATQAQVNEAALLLRNTIMALRRVEIGGPGVPRQPRVSISVIDPNYHGQGQSRVFFARQELIIGSGETVYSLLRRTGLNISSRGTMGAGMYVESINGWGEFSDGPGSGWMFRVNGQFPNQSASQINLGDGDRVEWLFTRDRGADIDGENVVTGPGPGTGGGAGPGAAPGTTPTPGGTVPGDGIGTPSEDIGNLARSFIDVNVGDWFYDAVRFANENGLMQGISEDVFAPNATLTRAMLVTILYRAEGEPVSSAQNPFNDVASNRWYTDAVIWASEHGIVEGFGDGRFAPSENITREQIATILMRFADWKDFDTSATTDLYTFADAYQISYWALDAKSWANAEGLITGRTETTLVPRGNATRAEAAVMLMRFLTNNF